MAWKKTEFLLKRRLIQHGLHDMVEAGALCRKAEELYPGLFAAVSVKEGVLHIELQKKNHMKFTMIRGKLQKELVSFAEGKDLPRIDHIRLTFNQD